MPSIAGLVTPEGVLVDMGCAREGCLLADQSGLGEDVEILPFKALLDTGATHTCLSTHIVQGLGIQPIGKVEMQGVAGPHAANQYRVDLVLRYGKQQFVVPQTMVGVLQVSKQHPFQALLGMDVIMRGAFTLSFDGHFTLSH